MPSKLLDLCDALADSLREVDWVSTTDPVYVERRNWPRVDVEDLQTPHVAVVAGGIEVTRLARSAHQHDHQLYVYLGRYVPQDADADMMLDLAEELVEVIEEHGWSTIAPAVTWPSGVTSPQAVLYELNPGEALQERNVWRAVLTVTYRLSRSY